MGRQWERSHFRAKLRVTAVGLGIAAVAGFWFSQRSATEPVSVSAPVDDVNQTRAASGSLAVPVAGAANSQQQGSSVTGAGPIGASPSIVPAIVPGESTPALIQRARTQLPTVAEIRKQIQASPEEQRRIQHGHPRAILEYAGVMGDLAERYADDPASREAIDAFYRDCALSQQSPDSIRALCYSHAVNHRQPGAQQDDSWDQGVSDRIREIAKRLPKSPVQ